MVETKDGLLKRRTVVAAAWAAPAVVAAASLPAFAASPDLLEHVVVDAYVLHDLFANGSNGPIEWNGGHVGFWDAPSGTTLNVVYRAYLTIPGGTVVPVVEGTTALTTSGQLTLPKVEVVADGQVVKGTYRITLEVTNPVTGATESDYEELTVK